MMPRTTAAMIAASMFLLAAFAAGTPTATSSTNATGGVGAAACADVDSELLGLLFAEEHPSRDNATSCPKLAALHACDHPAHGPKIRAACPVSCGACPSKCSDATRTTLIDAEQSEHAARAKALAADANATVANGDHDDDDDAGGDDDDASSARRFGVTWCTPGTYRSGARRRARSHTSGCSTCSNLRCAEGKYRSGSCSGARNGYMCRACAGGKFKTGFQAANYRGPTPCTDKTKECGSGYYFTGGDDNHKTSNDATCTPCPGGTFKTGTNAASSCADKTKECGSGYYFTGGDDNHKTSDDATCTPCLGGTFKSGSKIVNLKRCL